MSHARERQPDDQIEHTVQIHFQAVGFCFFFYFSIAVKTVIAVIRFCFLRWFAFLFTNHLNFKLRSETFMETEIC